METMGQLSHLNVRNTVELFDQQSFSDDEKFEIIQQLAINYLFDVIESFQKFKIKSEKCRYKAAAFLVTKSGRLISYRIKNFELSEHYLTKIAAEAIKNDPSGMLKYFQNYAIDENKAYPLALVAASLDGVGVAKYFKELGITAQDKVYAIAQRAFLSCACRCSKYIKNFRLEDESKRFELLRIRLKDDANKALDLLASFQINQPIYRVEAAILAASYDGWSLSAQIEDWRIPDEAERFRIFQSAFSNHPTGALRYIGNYKLSAPHEQAAFDTVIK